MALIASDQSSIGWVPGWRGESR